MRDVTLDRYRLGFNDLGGDVANLEAGRYVSSIAVDQGPDVYFLANLRESSVLRVYLHGAMKEEEAYPRFDRPQGKERASESYISIADPTVAKDHNLRVGWYLGARDWDPLPLMSQLVDRAQSVSGAARVVIIGGSGGGFAALRLGLKLPDSLVFCFNPQTAISAYRQRLIDEYFASVYGDASVARSALTADPAKFDMGVAYENAESRPAVFYSQSIGDTFHLEHHYLPFKRRMGVSTADGVATGASFVRFHLYDGSRIGHGPPNHEELAQQLNLATEWFETMRIGGRGVEHDVSERAVLEDATKPWDKVLNEVRRVRREVAAIQSGESSKSLRRRIVNDLMAVAALREHPVDRRPPLSGWALSPGVLLQVLSAVERMPTGSTVVELGSGSSTVWIADALSRRSDGATFESLEHDPFYYSQTRVALESAGLSEYVSLRLASLKTMTVDGNQFEWYTGWQGPRDVAVLLIDGPPGDLGPHARYPAIALIEQRLIDGGIVIVDDFDRQQEKEMVEAWGASVSGLHFSLVEVVDRAGIYRVSRPTGSPDV